MDYEIKYSELGGAHEYAIEIMFYYKVKLWLGLILNFWKYTGL